MIVSKINGATTPNTRVNGQENPEGKGGGGEENDKNKKAKEEQIACLCNGNGNAFVVPFCCVLESLAKAPHLFLRLRPSTLDPLSTFNSSIP